MALVSLLRALGRALAGLVTRTGFDNIEGLTERATDLAEGDELAEIAKDQALDIAQDAGAHAASKATGHAFGQVSHPVLAKASAFLATRAGFTVHAFNITRFGAQAGLASTARDQMVDSAPEHKLLFPWIDTPWGPYVIIAGAIAFSLAVAKLTGLEENKWGAAGVTAFASFVGEALLSSDEPGWAWEALLVAFFGAAISLLISFTPLGRKLEGATKGHRENRIATKAARSAA